MDVAGITEKARRRCVRCDMTANRKKRFAAAFGVALVAAVALLLLVRSANLILKHKLERRLGKDFSVGSLDLAWGSVQARDMKLLRDGELVMSAERVDIRADFLNFLKDHHIVSALSIERPHLRLEVDRRGPLQMPTVLAGDNTAAADDEEKQSVDFRKITVKSGEILYLDGRISNPPHPTRLTDVEIEVSEISAPLSNNRTFWSVSARMPGKSSSGRLLWQGTTDFTSKDTDGTMSLRDIDLIAMKPYYHKKGDAEVSRGTISVEMDVKVRERRVKAPGRAVIRDLEFRAGRGVGETFMGAPRTLVLGLLKSANNEIVLDFVVEGSLDDPTFTLREAMMKRIAMGLGQKLGLSALAAGGSVITEGARGLKEAGRTVCQGLNRLLGR